MQWLVNGVISYRITDSVALRSDSTNTQADLVLHCQLLSEDLILMTLSIRGPHIYFFSENRDEPNIRTADSSLVTTLIYYHAWDLSTLITIHFIYFYSIGLNSNISLI